jgi:hypothetical protein
LTRCAENDCHRQSSTCQWCHYIRAYPPNAVATLRLSWDRVSVRIGSKSDIGIQILFHRRQRNPLTGGSIFTIPLQLIHIRMQAYCAMQKKQDSRLQTSRVQATISMDYKLYGQYIWRVRGCQQARGC